MLEERKLEIEEQRLRIEMERRDIEKELLSEVRSMKNALANMYTCNLEPYSNINQSESSANCSLFNYPNQLQGLNLTRGFSGGNFESMLQNPKLSQSQSSTTTLPISGSLIEAVQIALNPANGIE